MIFITMAEYKYNFRYSNESSNGGRLRQTWRGVAVLLKKRQMLTL